MGTFGIYVISETTPPALVQSVETHLRRWGILARRESAALAIRLTADTTPGIYLSTASRWPIRRAAQIVVESTKLPQSLLVTSWDRDLIDIHLSPSDDHTEETIARLGWGLFLWMASRQPGHPAWASIISSQAPDSSAKPSSSLGPSTRSGAPIQLGMVPHRRRPNIRPMATHPNPYTPPMQKRGG